MRSEQRVAGPNPIRFRHAPMWAQSGKGQLPGNWGILHGPASRRKEMPQPPSGHRHAGQADRGDVGMGGRRRAARLHHTFVDHRTVDERRVRGGPRGLVLRGS